MRNNKRTNEFVYIQGYKRNERRKKKKYRRDFSFRIKRRGKKKRKKNHLLRWDVIIHVDRVEKRDTDGM